MYEHQLHPVAHCEHVQFYPHVTCIFTNTFAVLLRSCCLSGFGFLTHFNVQHLTRQMISGCTRSFFIAQSVSIRFHLGTSYRKSEFLLLSLQKSFRPLTHNVANTAVGESCGICHVTWK